MVSLLLSDPRIDPNKPSISGATPFFVSCQEGHKEVVSLLLADPIIDLNKPKNDQSTPLWYASQNGHLVVAQLLLASGRQIDTQRRSNYNQMTAAEQGRLVATLDREPHESVEAFERRVTNGPLIAALMDSFEKDPVSVRFQLRRQFGMPC